MILHIVFSHGMEGKQWGSKIKAMAVHVKQYGEIHSIDYHGIQSPDERAQKLIEYINYLSGDVILVGSSMGGYISTLASGRSNVKGLLLLAPALYLDGYNVSNPITPCENICVIHGWNDETVPYQNSIKFASEHQISLKLVNDKHRLADSQKVLNAELEAIILNLLDAVV